MQRKQTKSLPIASGEAVFPSFTFILLILMLVSIVLLGFLGGDEDEDAVQAQEPIPTEVSPELNMPSDSK